MKTIILLCLLAYGCHVACEAGVATDSNINEPTIKAAPTKRQQATPPKQNKIPKEIPYQFDPSSITYI